MQEDPVLNAPIYSLQMMLQALSVIHDEIPVVIPDGIFGKDTEAAVSAFQKLFQLPVTGTVGLETFQSIVSAYDAAMPLLLPPSSPVMLYPTEMLIDLEQSHPHVYLIQAMMSALHQNYQEILETSLTGRIDESTANNIRMIQNAASLPSNGKLDKLTFDAIARIYRASFDRQMMPACG